MEKYRGEIAIARVLDIVDDPFYKMLVCIETGHMAKEECFVAHKGHPEFSDNIIIRLDGIIRSKTDLDLEEYAGYFITSEIPEWFESGAADEVLLYGFWQKRMKNISLVPNFRAISNFYDPGFMVNVIHYSDKNGFICPYSLVSSNSPIICRRENGSIRPIGNSLRACISNIGSMKRGFPYVVTIDENIDFKRRILPEFIKTGLMYIEMEPEQ